MTSNVYVLMTTLDKAADVIRVVDGPLEHVSKLLEEMRGRNPNQKFWYAKTSLEEWRQPASLLMFRGGKGLD